MASRRRLENIAEITEAAAQHIDRALQGNELAQWDLGDQQITTAMTGIAGTVMSAATAEVDAEYEPGTLTPIQRMSVIATTAFRKAGALDLASVYLRAKLLKYIQDNRLLSVHPGAQYNNLADMASQNGCSVTEMCAILDFVNVLFPYLETTLQASVSDVWSKLGKSKLKEMLPVLKALITGTDPDTASTRNSVRQLIDNEYASMRLNNQYANDFEVLDNENNDPEDIAEAQARLQAVAVPTIINHLIDVGGDVPVAELRRVLRPDQNPEADVLVIKVGERFFMVSGLDDRQLQSIRQRIGHAANFVNVTLPENARQRQIEAMSIRTLRELITAVNS